jgi:hypothetical protein
MNSRHRRAWLRFTLLGIGALAAGKRTAAQSRREQRLEARNQPVGFRLAAQRIEWVESPELKISISRRDYGVAPISDQDRLTAQARVGDMLVFLRKGAESKVRETLESVKATGADHLLRLRAVGGHIHFNRSLLEWDGSGLSVEVEVLDTAGQSLWKETLQFSYGISAFSRQTAATAEIVDVLNDRLLRRMREVDLVAWR